MVIYISMFGERCNNTCATYQNIAAVIPINSAFSVGNNYHDIQLFYTNGTSLVDTNLMFKF